MRDEAVIKAALAEYAKGETTTRVIADKYGVCASTLTVWAVHSGVKLRNRGRTQAKEPTARQKEMLSLIPGKSYAEIGRLYGVCKQEVGRTAKRWPEYVGVAPHRELTPTKPKGKKCACA